uniref:Lipase n=1 Tax=Strigamia maritima TaxID=126957 RepID=T1J804_STRMM
MIRYGRYFALVLIILLIMLKLFPSLRTLRTNKYDDIIKEVSMNTENIKFMNDYQIEKHSVFTRDGYQLLLHRIPYGKTNSNLSKPTGVPVLIMHSWMCNSLSWIDNLEDSLGFVLADQLFDVWLGNVRGNEGSSHTSYGRNEAKFWDFSWEEIAEYDLPDTIDYIRNVTEYEKIVYIGLSLGSLMGFTLFSSQPEFNDKVAGFVALGPVTSLSYTTSLVMKILLNIQNTVTYLIETFQISQIQIVPRSFNKLALKISAYISITNSFAHTTRLPIYGRDCTESTSTKTVLHFKQIKPPAYNLSNIRIPVALFSSANDPIATPIDVAITARKLRNVFANEIVPEPMFSHLNFIWSHPSKTILYDKVVYLLKQMWDANSAS